METWIQLVDESGNPLKGPTLNRIGFHQVPNVTDFRKEIKKEFTYIQLKNLDANSLKVYANKAAFEAQENCLEDGSLMDQTLGPSKQEPVWVVVPQKSPTDLDPKLFSHHYPQYGGFDGINLEKDVHTPRDEKVNELISLVDQYGFIKILSPTMSGKTSLAFLTLLKLRSAKRRCIMYTCKAVDDNNQVFKQIFDHDFMDLLILSERHYRETGESTLLIIDDAQQLFRRNFSLWGQLKTIQSEKYLRLLCFATCGEYDCRRRSLCKSNDSPEVTPSQKLVLNFMMFSNDEIREYCVAYQSQKWTQIDVQLILKVADVLKDRCAGHPGLFTAAIQKIHDMYRDAPAEDLTLDELVKSCNGEELTHHLIHHRALKSASSLSLRNRDFCFKLLECGGYWSLDNPSSADQYYLYTLIRDFILIDTGAQFMLPYPVMKEALLRQKGNGS